jgi:uncharacterized protein YraI
MGDEDQADHFSEAQSQTPAPNAPAPIHPEGPARGCHHHHSIVQRKRNGQAARTPKPRAFAAARSGNLRAAGTQRFGQSWNLREAFPFFRQRAEGSFDILENNLMAARFALLLLLLTGFVSSAEAQNYSARVTTTLNMREGPGTQYRIITSIPTGTVVPVFGCYQGYAWCNVLYRNFRGWVSARYLQDPSRNAPVSTVGEQLGIALLQFFLNQLPRPPGSPSIPPVNANQVCFYADFNYQGSSFCANRGQSDPDLPSSWNDRISSLRVGPSSGGALVCRDFFYQGGCDYITSDVNQLGSTRNDTYSSYRIGQGNAGPFPPPPPPPPPVGQVCFYEHWDFQGASFCRGPGQNDPDLPPDWNDRISSVRVDSTVYVQICSDFGYSGQCTTLGGNVSQLTGTANDSISSYRVFPR